MTRRQIKMGRDCPAQTVDGSGEDGIVTYLGGGRRRTGAAAATARWWAAERDQAVAGFGFIPGISPRIFFFPRYGISTAVTRKFGPKPNGPSSSGLLSLHGRWVSYALFRKKKHMYAPRLRSAPSVGHVTICWEHNLNSAGVFYFVFGVQVFYRVKYTYIILESTS